MQGAAVGQIFRCAPNLPQSAALTAKYQRTSDVLFSIASGFLSIASLSYSIVLFQRIKEHSLEGTHIGGDVMVIAYLTPIVAVIFALRAWKTSSVKFVKIATLIGSLLALLAWLYLHFSGKVFSHSSMFS